MQTCYTPTLTFKLVPLLMTLVSLLMAPKGHVVIELVTAVLTVIPDNPQLDVLASAAEKRIAAALRPRTRCSYLAGF